MRFEGLVDEALLGRAEALVRQHAPPTPCEPHPGAEGVVLKREDVGPCGVFKWRGALAALGLGLPSEDGGRGGQGGWTSWPAGEEGGGEPGDGSGGLRRRAGPTVVAASTGNHGLGLAWAGRRLGRPVEIYVPRGANPGKLERIRAEGAVIVEAGTDLDEAIAAARERAAGGGAELVVDGEHLGIFPGTATIGAEIAAQVPDAARVVVPVGNGALVTGVALGLRLRGCGARIVGVAAAGAPVMYRSWREGRPVDGDRCRTIADGLAVRLPQQPATDAVIELVEEFLLVSDPEMEAAMVEFHRLQGELLEPAGAAGLAALDELDAEGAGPTVVVVTGRNVDPALAERLPITGSPAGHRGVVAGDEAV